MCYCGRVEKVFGPHQGEWDLEPRTTLTLTRFGLDRSSMEPVTDGHQSTFYLSDLAEVAPGVWRDLVGDEWDLEPTYWRDMGPRGQLELFSQGTNQ